LICSSERAAMALALALALAASAVFEPIGG
jgi:hypothetical protein